MKSTTEKLGLFATRVKQRREELGMSRIQVIKVIKNEAANRADGEPLDGLAPSELSRIESGQLRNLNVWKALNLARALRCNLKWLCGQTDNMSTPDIISNDSYAARLFAAYSALSSEHAITLIEFGEYLKDRNNGKEQ